MKNKDEVLKCQEPYTYDDSRKEEIEEPIR